MPGRKSFTGGFMGGVIKQISVPLALMAINHRASRSRKHRTKHRTKHRSKHHAKHNTKRRRVKKGKFTKKRR